MADSLKGKVAVITGVGSGFGKATAELFAKLDQVNLVLIDLDERPSTQPPRIAGPPGQRSLPSRAT